MTGDEWRAIEGFNDCLDALARGDPGKRRDVDPALLATDRLIRVRDDARSPDPAFVGRLEGQLMHALGRTAIAAATTIAPAPSVIAVPAREPARAPDEVHRRRAMIELAAVAAIMAIAIAGIFARDRLIGEQAAQPTGGATHVPAPTATVSVPVVEPPESARKATAPSDDASMYRANAARTGEMPGPGPKGKPGLLWRVDAYGGTLEGGAPIVSDGLIFRGEGSKQRIVALDASTGEVRWRVNIGLTPDADVAVANGAVYVTAYEIEDGQITSGAVVALDAATGEERWRTSTGATDGSPAVADGAVFVIALQPRFSGSRYEDSLLALDAATGMERWRFPITSSGYNANAGKPSPTMAVANGLAYVGTNLGVVHAIDTATGEERWHIEMGASSAIGTPVVADGFVFVGVAGDVPRWRSIDPDALAWLGAFDAATGAERWIRSVPGRVPPLPAAVDGLLFLGSGVDTHVSALDAATGKERWSFPLGSVVTALPIVADGVVYVGTLDAQIDALDAASGELRWRIDTSQSPDRLAVANGVIYAFVVDTVVAFGDEITS